MMSKFSPAYSAKEKWVHYHIQLPKRPPATCFLLIRGTLLPRDSFPRLNTYSVTVSALRVPRSVAVGNNNDDI